MGSHQAHKILRGAVIRRRAGARIVSAAGGGTYISRLLKKAARRNPRRTTFTQESLPPAIDKNSSSGISCIGTGGFHTMAWNVLYDEEFSEWLLTVDEGLRLKIASHLEVLEEFGPNLGRPRVDTVKGSGYPNEGIEGAARGGAVANLVRL